MHAGYNGRGEYYSAANAQQLADQIRDALVTIKDASGGANAVSFNTQKVDNSTVVYTAGYNSADNTGEVSAIPYVNGVLSATPTWQASNKLATQLAAARPTPPSPLTAGACGDGSADDQRVILTYDYGDPLNSVAPAGIALRGPLFNGLLSATEVDWLRGHNYPEQQCGGSLRNRASSTMLGDIAHSRPLFIGDPAMPNRGEAPYPTGVNAYANFVKGYASGGARDSARQATVMVGANDGLFHSFLADGSDAGVELFAYMPRLLINDDNSANNSVKTLLDPNYSHRFFVDLAPAVNDVFVSTPTDSVSGDNWRTVAIGGLRGGGRGYFALDVTETAAFANETSGKTKVMWEFSNLDHSGLGLTYSPPIIAMSNLKKANNSQRWLAIFGNGYNSDDGQARLFALDIEQGADGWVATDYYVFTPSDGAAGTLKNGLGVPRAVDIDENGTVDYVYAGDLKGNLYRFDLSSANASDYDTAGELTARSTTVFSAASNQPITTQPIVVRHPISAGTVIVTVATGSWFQEQDAVDTSTTQSIYGVWDRLTANPAMINRSHMVERELENVMLTGDTTVYRAFKDSTPISWYNGTGSANATNAHGWYLDFDMPAFGSTSGVEFPGEKAVREMIMKDGFAFVNTVIPAASRACDISLTGASLAFNPQTGGLSQILLEGKALGTRAIAGMQFDGLPSNATILEGPMPKVVTEVTAADGSKTLVATEFDTGAAGKVGRLAWRQIE